ncbi:GTP-binding protein YchF [Ramicandelaber brevisporus]|nr:GTP-binding protein YchF [Ramicandelaber brevisporus]
MPPKKAVEEKKLQLGRPGNNLKVGVVGLPNVGKSSLFNVLTSSDVLAANYPFATIDPNEARVAVPDDRLGLLAKTFGSSKIIPAYLTVIDIAGLVKGAADGQGLGNAFLSHIKAVDAIFHVMRAFDDDDVTHVEGGLDPVRDMEIIHNELRLKDIELLSKQTVEMGRQVARIGTGGSVQDKLFKEEYEILCKVQKYLEDGNDVRKGDWTNKEVEVINGQQFITAKPVIYLINLSETDYIRKKNKWLPKIAAWIKENSPGDQVIPFSATFETELIGFPSQEERDAHCKEVGAQSVLPKIIVSGYNTLSLMYYFTAGPQETRAWTIRKGTKAPQAAGVIHTDFERGFIMAETYKFDDLKELGSESAVKAAGKYHMKGKEYEVQDGDIIFFKFNVTAQPKKK